MSGLFRAPSAPQQVEKLQSLQLQASQMGIPIPIVFGQTRIPGFLLWYGDFVAIPHTTTSSTGGGKGGGGGYTSTTYTYQAAFMEGLCEGPIGGVIRTWANNAYASGIYPFAAYEPGSYSQPVWSYLTTYHSTQALSYPGVAWVGDSLYNLGSSANLPNHTFEIQAQYSYNAGAGLVDANPKDILYQLLSNPNWGAMFPSSRIGDLTQYSNYCVANNILISPAYTSQTSAASILTELMTNTNSEMYYSEGQIKVVPRGDTAVTGNGVTYTPNVTPLYDLTDDDFLTAGGNEPVLCERGDPVDAFNDVIVEYVDRNNYYAPATAEARDQASIILYGLRPMSKVTFHAITQGSVAQSVASLLLQRALYIRNVFTFHLGWQYSQLEPMDIVTITDSALQLTKWPVRIISIEEDEWGTLQVQAEDFPAGVNHHAIYSTQAGSGYNSNFNVAPSNTNAPILLAPPVGLAATPELWLIASGNPATWGGCMVYASSDGNTYTAMGFINPGARQGTLQSPLASGSDPDTVNTLSVDLTESVGALLSGTQADADNNNTLCYVDGELISYETATLTAANKYNLTYLRRGRYGTAIAAHSAGTQFARLDGNVFKLPYTASQIGKPLYIKLAAVNQYQQAQQDISTLPAYAYTIPAPPVPPDVTNFAVQEVNGVVVFKWDAIIDYALKGYDIGYAPQGTVAWSAFTPITEVAAGSEMTNASIPPGTWVFGIRARDIVNQLSTNITTQNLVVTNPDVVISDVIWKTWELGTVVNAVPHISGSLIPKGTKTCDQYVAISSPAAPVLSAVTGGSGLGARTYFVKTTYTTSAGETLPSAESSISLTGSQLLQVASPAAAAGAAGWDVYVSTASGTETQQNIGASNALGTPWTEPSTGLIAGTAMPSSNTTGWEVFDSFVPDPVTSCSFATTAIDTGYDSTLRAYANPSVALGLGQTGIPSTALGLDTWLTGQSDSGIFVPWTIGYATLRYARFQFSLVNIVAGSVPVLNQLETVIDKAPTTEYVGSVTVAPGGTAVTFPQQFHVTPQVQATATSTGATSASATNITTTGCTLHVWTGGTDTGGTCSYTATGE